MLRLGHYREYGNERPPISDLQQLVEAYDRIPDPTYHQKLKTADICIDYGFADPTKSRRYFTQANMLIGGVVKTLWNQSQQRPRSFRRNAPVLAAAYLRQRELRAWRSAANGLSPEANYDGWLTTMTHAAGFIGDHGQVPLKIIEAVPILLGARGLQRGTRGWIGRLALERERGAPDTYTAVSTRMNWNVGICAESTVDEFDRPSYKINTTRGVPWQQGMIAERRQANPITDVSLLRARSFGFKNPEQVIWSCAREQDGGVPQEVADHATLTTERLDAITEQIWEFCQQAASAPGTPPEQ